MPEEQENQIERREPGGGIGRRSDIARRGMNAANYVRGLTSRQEADLQQTTVPTEYTYKFWLEWGTKGMLTIAEYCPVDGKTRFTTRPTRYRQPPRQTQGRIERPFLLPDA